MFKEIFEDERKIASSYRRQTMPKKKKSLGKQKNPSCVLLLALETLDIKTNKEETDQKAPKVLSKMFEQTQNLIRNF